MRNPWLQWPCIALLAMLPITALAQPLDPSIDCKRVETEGGNTYEMGQCAGRANGAIQRQLGQVLKQLRAVLPTAADRQTLDAAQASWSTWTRKEADLCARSMGYSPDGSGFGLQWASCETRLNRERTTVLQRYLRQIQSRR